MSKAVPLSGEDRLAIMELYARHAWAMDTGDTEAFLAVYAPGATAYGATGEAQIRDWHERFLKDSAFPGSHHFASQFRIVEVSDDSTRALTRAYLVRMFRVPGTTNIQPVWLGYYTDTVVKISGEWKFLIKHAHLTEHLFERRFEQDPETANVQQQNLALHELYDMGAARA
jgi:hypothetical protein